MKVIEEEYLKKTIIKLNRFAKEHRDFLDFFNDVEAFLKTPLQEQSFKGDLELFDELAFILSVITSIIKKPHIASKGEEIILRSELAPSLSNEMFQKTLRDSTIWSQEGLDMVPQYVYYYQHVDELKIYENIFVTHLINKIDTEITKYNEFYQSMIQTYDSSSESLSLMEDFITIALNKLNLLTRKIKFIKNSHFYRVIRKDAMLMKTVHPTNILIKDRLYNLCYKFYKSMITYVDESEKTKDFRAYYYVHIIKALKSLGFKLEYKPTYVNLVFDDSFQISPLEFYNSEFVINIYPEVANNGLVLEVRNRKISKGKNISKNLLVFDTKTKFEDLELENKDDYDSVEIASLWNFGYAYDDVKAVFEHHVTEQDIMKFFIESKLKNSKCSIDLYTKYCPSCKSTDVVEKKNSYYCECCHSKYVFYLKNKTEENLWFLRYRRKSF